MSWLLFTVKVILGSAVLAAATLLINPLAAVSLVCLALWLGLFMTLRALRRERQRIDGAIAAQRDRYDSIVGVLCGALHLQDDINTLHTGRVVELASMVAEEMGMRKEEIRLLQKAAILADIGKAEIAESILTKPGSLSEQEWREMKRHPESGYEALGGISNLRDAGAIVRSHHERFDGQGYPQGLNGEAIPLGARIFTIVDAYTAMTSDRPHRKKMAHEAAMREILRNSLTQFDPEVVRAFARCEERGMVTAGARTNGHGAEAADVAA